VTDLLSYLKRIETIKRAPSRSDAPGANFGKSGSPYKLILLLVIVRSLREPRKSPFKTGRIDYDDCIGPFFELHSELIQDTSNTHRDEQIVVQPFWNFATGVPQLWDITPVDGKAMELTELLSRRPKLQVKTPKKLKNLIAYAEIPAADLALLTDKTANRAIEHFILNEYFPSA
jgi:hypothetical protein